MAAKNSTSNLSHRAELSHKAMLLVEMMNENYSAPRSFSSKEEEILHTKFSLMSLNEKKMELEKVKAEFYSL